MTLPRTLGKMNTTVERVFRRTPDGFFLEVYLHFLNFLNEDGSLRSSKLDKEVSTGKLWRVARPGERSSYGEVDYLFPGQPKAVRLLCVSKS
jgi:hypothetical protein